MRRKIETFAEPSKPRVGVSHARFKGRRQSTELGGRCAFEHVDVRGDRSGSVAAWSARTVKSSRSSREKRESVTRRENASRCFRRASRRRSRGTDERQEKDRGHQQEKNDAHRARVVFVSLKRAADRAKELVGGLRAGRKGNPENRSWRARRFPGRRAGTRRLDGHHLEETGRVTPMSDYGALEGELQLHIQMVRLCLSQ